jgi:hypothetical protein
MMREGADVMRLWREQGIVWAALLLLSNSSLAASISLAPLDNDPAHARVAVDGRFEAGDEIKFRTEVGRLTKAVVVFNSDGGNLLAGIEIGKTIRLKSFATAVLNGLRCASSCAFAWLGGSPRLMERGAQIGFHAAYTLDGGRASESGVGNALVGSYLTQIGLSEAAVVYITQAAPTQLTLLTLQDAERIGIEVLPFEQHAPPTKPAPQADETERSKYAVNGLDGLSLGGRASPQSNDYQEYQCTPSEQFEGVTWCNKQRLEKEARGSYRSSYTIAHSRDGIIYYLNRSLEPAFFNAGEADRDIELLSRKFGGQARRFSIPRGLAPVDGLIAVWGKVTLESLDPTGVKELAAGRSPRQGILVDFIGNLTDSARRGLPIYRVTGGPGFVWAASFNPQGRGTLRFFAIDPSALLPGTAKESTAPAPTNSANPQGDCDRLAANPSDRRKPPSVPGVPYDSLMNQAKQAIAACTVAVQQSPTELRYQYQMARAMEAEAPEKALEIHRKLVGQGYPVAYDNLGWLEIKLFKNYGAAIKYFKAGSQLRDPDSMVSLVEMVDRGYLPTDRPQELKCQLLRTAAGLGHQGAQLQIQEEEKNCL